MNLETTYLGLKLAHPVIAAASPLSATLDGIRRLEDAGAAAIVTASLYEEVILAQEEALDAGGLVGAESHPEVTSYIPPLCGCRTPLASHLQTIERAADSIAVPLIASLHATTRHGWVTFSADLQAAGAAAIEINFTHNPTNPSESSADVEASLIEIVRNVRTTVQVPLAVKIGPQFAALPHLAISLGNAGADAIVLFNRSWESDINLDSMAFRPVLQLSTPDDIHLVLSSIAALAGKTRLALAATGGVDSVDAVLKYLLAGADVVAVASFLLRHGPHHLHDLVEQLREWMEAHNVDSVDNIRGRLRLNWDIRPAALGELRMGRQTSSTSFAKGAEGTF